MKKYFLLLATVLLMLAMSLPVQAQLKFGIKGGLNLTKITGNGSYAGLKDNTTGFFIGPMLDFRVPVIGLGVDGALMYAQTGNADVRQKGLEIPINLKYHIGLGNMASLFVAAGPDFFLNFKNISKDLSENFKQNKFQTGLSLGAGVKLINHLQLGVNYVFPLTKTLTPKKDAPDVRLKTWQVSLAYLF